MELLFESRMNILDCERRLRFIQVKPTVNPDPVMLPDTPADGSWVSLYGTVLRDGGRLRMWYQAWPKDWDWKNDSGCVGYAESDDGLNWTKPKLNLVERGYGPNNLLNMFLGTPTVFIDPDSPATHRYRATGCAYPGQFASHPEISDIKEAGYFTSHSADGLNWQLDAMRPRWYSADNIYNVYHPGRRCAQIAMKYIPRIAGRSRRSWHLAEFRDGQYGDDVPAIYPDDFDEVCAQMRGAHTCDYYAFTMMPAGMGTVGFVLKLWGELPYTGPQFTALYGAPEVALVYQPCAGAQWQHVPGRPAFLEARGLPWIDGWFSCSSCPVEVGDEHWLYISGRNRTHGFGRKTDWDTIPRWIDWARAHNHNAIGLVRWPKWRLFGFEGDPDGSFVLDLGPIDRPSELVLNYRTKADGCVKVALAHGPKRFSCHSGWKSLTVLPNRSIEDAVPLTGDSIGATVAWKDGTTIAPSGDQHVFARIELEVAGAFAYEVKPKA